MERRCGRGGTVGGAVVGGLVGGIAGNRIAGRVDRTAGTLIGAGVGALAGSALGNAADKQKCERSDEHTSALQSLMRISYAVFCLKIQQLNPKSNPPTSHHAYQQSTPR